MPVKPRLVIAFAIYALASSAFASEGIVSATTDLFSESADTGMKLGAVNALKRGDLPPDVAKCIQRSRKEDFYPLVYGLLSKYLSPAELASADRYYSTPTGYKVGKQSILALYNAAHIPAPFPQPMFNSDDESVAREFASTTAHEKLNRKVVMQQADAMSVLKAKIDSIVKRCGAAHAL